MKPLQVRAAELLRGGFSQREAGLAVGRSERTIRVWLLEVDGFREAVESGAEAGDLSPIETLRLALGATRGDGSPDWRIRGDSGEGAAGGGVGVGLPVVSVPPGGIVVYPEALDAALGES